MNLAKRWIHLFVMLAFSLAASGSAFAHQALVVGVNRYLALGSSRFLSGGVNDARSMKASLESYDFQVTMLTDERATRKNIVNTFRSMRSRCKPDERFVFYFAGYGSRDATFKPILLPSDARSSDGSRDINFEELRRWMKAIPAKSRTILLDAGFSGGASEGWIARKMKGAKERKNRFHSRSGMKVESAVQKAAEMADADSTDFLPGSSDGEICYLIASGETESAFETQLGGASDGIFTRDLTKIMQAGKVEWGDLHREVLGRVREDSGDLQHPRLSAAYRRMEFFDELDRSYAPASPMPKTVWDLLNSDDVSDRRLNMTIVPSQNPKSDKSRYPLVAKVSANGYLAVMKTDAEGKTRLVWPPTGKASDAFAHAGQTIRISDGADDDFADEAGWTFYKAYLFQSEAWLTALMDSFAPPNAVLTRSRMKSRTYANSRDTESQSYFYTKELSFDIKKTP